MENHFISSKDESVRIFKNDFLESLSKVHYTVPLILYVPVILFFLYKSIFITDLSLLSTLGLAILGVFAWTFAEYTIHRFVFHYHPTSKLGKRIHFMAHGVHHDYPNDSKRLVLVPGVSIPLACLFYYLFHITIGASYADAFFSGFVAGYVFYDTTHYALHHWNFKNKFWLNLKKHHMLHHYKDSENGFGVSSKFWDYVFKTMFERQKSKIGIWLLLCLAAPFIANADIEGDPIAMGDKYFEQMRYRDAAAWYCQSTSEEAQWKMARAYVCYGDIAADNERENYYRKAETAAKNCIKLNEKNGYGHTYLAAALGNIAVYEGSKTKVRLCNEIKKELLRAIELNPNDDVAYSVLGSFYRILGNISWLERSLAKAFIGTIPEGGYKDSEKYLLKAISINPSIMRHWYELGLLYNDWDKKDKAKQSFFKAQNIPVKIASDKDRLSDINHILKD